jgi:pimeloyl-ACP methyl ester carboxylesterase
METPKPKVKRGLRYWLNLIVAFFLMFYLVLLVRGYFMEAPRWAHPPRDTACCTTPADDGIRYEDVSFKTSDGLTLKGWYVPSRNGATVMLLHGLGGTRTSMIRHLLMLEDAGFGLLDFDLRAHGESEGEAVRYDGHDALAAYQYLLTRKDVDPQRIGALGWSLGAMIAIQAAAQEPGIKAVAADEPGSIAFKDWPLPEPLDFGNWLYVPFDLFFYPTLPLWTGTPNGQPISEAIAAISPRPLLMIRQEDSYTVAYLYGFAREPKSEWTYPTVGHGMGPVNYPDEYAAQIKGFFEKNLLDQ